MMEETKEEWREIKGYNGVYLISSFGRILSIAREIRIKDGNYRRAKQQILRLANRGGYSIVTLCIYNKKTSHTVHRLVAEAFIPKIDNKLIINHKNGIKTDNRVENLEWSNHSENGKHSYQFLGRKHPALGKKGYESYCGIPVKQYSLSGDFIQEFGSAKEAGRVTGICSVSISGFCRGKIKTAGGFIWKKGIKNK